MRMWTLSLSPHHAVTQSYKATQCFTPNTHRMMSHILSLATFAVLVVSSTRGEQTPLKSGRESVASIDYADLFSADRQIANAPPWTRESWNGLVSFARAPPLRCWGAEADVLYDIAVIGGY
jgi:hypothetical protein